VMMKPGDAEANFQAGRMLLRVGERGRGGSYLNYAAALAGPRSDISREASMLIDREALSLFINTFPPAEPVAAGRENE